METLANSTAQAIGILGGSFNPPHSGHVLAAHYALLRWPLKKILVVPSHAHPFGKKLPDFTRRLEMCRLAFQHLGSFVEISDIEQRLGKVSYTVETVRELRRLHPTESFNLIVGGDILSDIEKWHEVEQLKTLAPFLVIPRIKEGEILGGDSAAAALPDVSSTSIRTQLKAGATITGGTVPAAVLRFIQKHNLYSDQAD